MRVNPNINTYKAQNLPATQLQQAGVNVAGQSSKELQIQPNQVAALKNTALANTSYTKIDVKKIPNVGDANIYKLSNGQKLVILKRTGPTVVRTFVKTGAMNEPDNLRGISHYIEHNLFNGSKNLQPNEFVNKITSMGGTYNAGTGFYSTNYYIKAADKDPQSIAKLLDMHTDMMQNPTFSEKMLEKERGPVISEIQMVRDNPDNMAFNSVLKDLFNIKSTSKSLIAGSVQNIENVKRGDVVDYFNKWYTPDNMTTVVIGDINPDSTASLLASRFNKKAPALNNNETKLFEPLQVTNKTVRSDLKSSQINSCKVLMGFAGADNNDVKSNIATSALSVLLTGHKNARLTQELKSMNTEAAVFTESIGGKFDDPNVIFVNADFKSGEEEKGLKTLYKVLHETAYIPPSTKEMVIIKNALKNQIEDTSQSAMSISQMIGDSIINTGSISAYSDSLKYIDSLTPQDVQNAAKQFLNLNKTAITMIHPESANQVSFTGQTLKTEKTSFNGVISSVGSDIKVESPINKDNIAELILPNNAFLVMNHDKMTPKTLTSIGLSTQVEYPGYKPGMAEILSEILSYGTAYKSEENFYDLTELNNIDVGAMVSSEGISTIISSKKETLPLALELAKEKFLAPNLNQETLNRAKESLKLDYLSAEKSPLDKGYEELFKGEALGRSKQAIFENLKNITVADIQAFHGYLVNNSSAKIVSTGDFKTSPDLKNMIMDSATYQMPMFKAFNHSASNKTSKPLDKNIVTTQAEGRNQADIVQLFKFNETGNVKDKAAFLLLNEILGGNSNSRLFNDLREKQKLAYRVNSKYSSIDNVGVMKLQIMTTTENGAKGDQFKNVQKSLDGFKKHIQNLKETRVSMAELKSAKAKIKSAILFGAESTFGKNSIVESGLNTAYGIEYTQKLIDEIDKINPVDIQKAANLFFNSKSVISVLAGQKTLDSNKDYLAKLNV